MKDLLKRAVGPRWRTRLRRVNRLRWITKYRLMRALGSRASLRHRLAYVLLDPETESFSYELENQAELIAALADALGRDESELAAYAAEVDRDPELGALLARHVGRRFDVKHRPPLGHRLAWYVIARAVKPETVVETGIHLGLGSLALLRAVARNEREGHPGQLVSIDSDPDAGSLVRDELRANWHRVTGLTRDTLLPAIDQRRVGMLIQDTAHTEENQRFEFGAALSHASDELVLIDASGGWAPTLRALAEERGVTYYRVPVRSRNHIYPGLNLTFAVFGSADRVAPEKASDLGRGQRTQGEQEPDVERGGEAGHNAER
jgi:Methyltransferase domain